VNCERVRDRITAYLGGELDETTASSLRGHLRLCADCRRLGEEHAHIVDALQAMAPPEPPADPMMWRGIKARLGEAEIEDSRRSPLALLWRRVRPNLVPAFALAGAAAIVGGVWIVHRRGGDPGGDADAREAMVAVAPTPPAPPAPPPHPVAPAGSFTDVADDLRQDDARADAAYRAAAEDLLAMAGDARATWAEPQAKSFDARVGALRTAVDHAPLGEARERAWQALIDYVQRTVVGVRIAEAP
jgi:hypothetical protein